jgi:hypothetical protein
MTKKHVSNLNKLAKILESIATIHVVNKIDFLIITSFVSIQRNIVNDNNIFQPTDKNITICVPICFPLLLGNYSNIKENSEYILIYEKYHEALKLNEEVLNLSEKEILNIVSLYQKNILEKVYLSH